MSDAVRQNLKISREGIVLIKSLEGFRPRALKRGNQWVIGYGHTLSAREGASVSEQEAELLLQYDLLPVVRAVNEATTAWLNQHQFDALASFAHSVGIDEFRASKVLRRLNAGETAQAADALMAWPDKPAPEAPVRRRGAERALFLADPEAATTVADLMTAPLPPVDEDGTVLPFPFNDPQAAACDEAGLGSASPTPDPAAPPVIASVADAIGDKPVAFDGPVTERPLVPEDEILPVMRHEARTAAVEAFDWSHSGPLLVIGAIGFLCFGVAMGALRLAAMPSGRAGETAATGWLLLFVAAVCLGLSGWKLYERWGRSER